MGFVCDNYTYIFTMFNVLQFLFWNKIKIFGPFLLFSCLTAENPCLVLENEKRFNFYSILGEGGSIILMPEFHVFFLIRLDFVCLFIYEYICLCKCMYS